MRANDMRAWLVMDPTWAAGSVPERRDASAAAPVTRDGFGLLLDSAATGGDSAFIGICFDIDNR